MTDLFLDPKVLDYREDRYDLILMTLKWARAMKAKGTPEPMPVLIEKALKDIVEKKITFEEINANKVEVAPPVEEIPDVVSVAGDGKAVLAPDDDEDEKKPAKKKKKKDE